MLSFVSSLYILDVNPLLQVDQIICWCAGCGAVVGLALCFTVASGNESSPPPVYGWEGGEEGGTWNSLGLSSSAAKGRLACMLVYW